MRTCSLYVLTKKPQECRRFSGGNGDHPGLRGAPARSGNGRSEENAALGNRAHHGPNAGWRSVFDPELWRQGLVAATAGAVSMGMLACAVALARDTTAHDWYAAARLTVADILIGVGFDEHAPVEFRKADGVVETVTRSALTDSYRVRWAREHILEAAWEGATLGAISGFGGALLCFVLVRRSMDDRRGRRPANGPAPDRRREAREPLASPQDRPMSGSPPPPASLAPTHAPANRPPVSSPPPAAKPEPTVTRHDKPGAGKDDKAEPARGERRKRDYGRWV